MDLGSIIPTSNILTLPYLSDNSNTPAANLIHDCYSAGFVGSFRDNDDNPEWARRIARYNHDEFMADTPGTKKLYSDIDVMLDNMLATDGAGECHINCRYALELWEAGGRKGPKPYSNRQDYGSCVDISKAEGVTSLIAWRIVKGGFNEVFLCPDAWYNYADRGYCNDGWDGGGIATVARKYGCAFRMKYNLPGGEVDFTDDDENERIVARQWCRTGSPQWLRDHTMANHAFEDGAIVRFNGDAAAVKKIMAGGGFLHHGGTRTSGGSKPFTIGSTGSHMQTTHGYDDTDEARKFFRDKGFQIADDDFPVVNGQTWGEGWRGETASEYWPPWWGPKMEGAWVWRNSDMMNRIGYEYAWMPWVKGFPSAGPTPIVNPPLTGAIFAEQVGTGIAIRGELVLTLPDGKTASYIVVPDSLGRYHAVTKPVI